MPWRTAAQGPASHPPAELNTSGKDEKDAASHRGGRPTQRKSLRSMVPCSCLASSCITSTNVNAGKRGTGLGSAARTYPSPGALLVKRHPPGVRPTLAARCGTCLPLYAATRQSTGSSGCCSPRRKFSQAGAGTAPDGACYPTLQRRWRQDLPDPGHQPCARGCDQSSADDAPLRVGAYAVVSLLLYPPPPLPYLTNWLRYGAMAMRACSA